MNIRSMLFIFIALLIVAGCGKDENTGLIEATGTIEAVEVTVSSKVGAEVKEMRVDEGSMVKEGDVICILDTTISSLQRNQARAAVDMARARLRLLQVGAREEDKGQAAELVAQAEAAWKVAEADAGRMRELFQAGSVSEKQKDDTEARAAVTRAQYNAAVQGSKKVDNIARPEELAAARAGLRQAQAGLEIARQQLEYCTIISPATGMITARMKEPGELVGQGSPVVTISKGNRVELMIYVAEKDLGKVRLNQAATVKIDTYPDREFPGTVVYFSPEAEFTPKNIQTKEDRVKLVFGVKIGIDNPEGILKGGMPADAEILPGGQGT